MGTNWLMSIHKILSTWRAAAQQLKLDHWVLINHHPLHVLSHHAFYQLHNHNGLQVSILQHLSFNHSQQVHLRFQVRHFHLQLMCLQLITSCQYIEVAMCYLRLLPLHSKFIVRINSTLWFAITQQLHRLIQLWI